MNVRPQLLWAGRKGFCVECMQFVPAAVLSGFYNTMVLKRVFDGQLYNSRVTGISAGC